MRFRNPRPRERGGFSGTAVKKPPRLRAMAAMPARALTKGARNGWSATGFKNAIGSSGIRFCVRSRSII